MVASCHYVGSRPVVSPARTPLGVKSPAVFSWRGFVFCATPATVAKRRKIPQPNKHFRLVLWFLLYRVHPQQRIDRRVEIIACERCRNAGVFVRSIQGRLSAPLESVA
jgi:hypothetical protein